LLCRPTKGVLYRICRNCEHSECILRLERLGRRRKQKSFLGQKVAEVVYGGRVSALLDVVPLMEEVYEWTVFSASCAGGIPTSFDCGKLNAKITAGPSYPIAGL